MNTHLLRIHLSKSSLAPCLSTLLLLLLLPTPFLRGEEPPPIVGRKISLPEISGVMVVGSKLVVAADDSEKDQPLNMVALLDKGPERLFSGGDIAVTPDEQIYASIFKFIGESEAITDIEDIAKAPNGDVVLTTSHSRNKKNESKPKRQRLLRLRFDETTSLLKGASLYKSQLIEALPSELKDSAEHRPGETGNPGFNIEGLAWTPGEDLFFGVRSPLLPSPDDSKKGMAVVLRLKNAEQVFTAPPATLPLSIEARLDLGGLGIRGMTHDETQHGYWLIAGLSPDPDDPDKNDPDPAPRMDNPWSIWFWDGKASPQKRLTKDQLPSKVQIGNPEAVCLMIDPKTHTECLLLISDNGGDESSSYAVIPIARLK